MGQISSLPLSVGPAHRSGWLSFQKFCAPTIYSVTHVDSFKSATEGGLVPDIGKCSKAELYFWSESLLLNIHQHTIGPNAYELTNVARNSTINSFNWVFPKHFRPEDCSLIVFRKRFGKCSTRWFDGPFILSFSH